MTRETPSDGRAGQPRPLLLHPWLTLRVQIALGAIFVAAALPKIVDPPSFAHMVFNYRLIPGALVNAMAHRTKPRHSQTFRVFQFIFSETPCRLKFFRGKPKGNWPNIRNSNASRTVF